jgi:hypothetical protein
MTQNLLRTLGHADLGRDTIFRWQRCTLVAPFDYPGSVVLRMSRSVELFSDGDLLLRMWVFVGRMKGMGSFFNWQSPDMSAPVGSVEMENMLQDGIAQLSQNLKQGVDVFVEHLPADEGPS